MNPIANATVSTEQSSSNGGSHDAGESSSWPAEPVLTEEMLLRFVSRSATNDGEKGAFEAGIEDLPETKHLLSPLPVEFGGDGAGMTLSEACREAGGRRKT